MEYEDSKNALFCDPNAYVQNFSKEKKEIKKIVFSEPYETMPNYYINNNFRKKNCDCIEKPKQKNCQPLSNNSMLDFKNLIPMLGGFLNKGIDIGSLTSMLNGNTDPASNNNGMMSNIMSLLSSDIGKNILGFMGKNSSKNSKKNNKKIQKIKTNDFCIDDYERVD